MYLAQHKYAEAEPLFIKANQINHRVLGEEHPDTLLTMNGLGALYYLEGKYTQAELLFEKALEGQRRVLGDEHEQTQGRPRRRLCGFAGMTALAGSDGFRGRQGGQAG